MQILHMVRMLSWMRVYMHVLVIPIIFFEVSSETETTV
jgi:hypothetical protein